MWCSQRSRQAAYEERQAAAGGVLALEFVQPIEMTLEHDQGECVARVVASPTACRRILQEMARLARTGDLIGDPKWEPGLDAFGKFAHALVQHRVSSLGFRADRTRERSNLSYGRMTFRQCMGCEGHGEVQVGWLCQSNRADGVGPAHLTAHHADIRTHPSDRLYGRNLQ